MTFEQVLLLSLALVVLGLLVGLTGDIFDYVQVHLCDLLGGCSGIN